MAELLILSETFNRADETPLATPYITPVWTAQVQSQAVNLVSNAAKLASAAGTGVETGIALKSDVTCGWNCRIDVVLGAVDTAHLFWQVGLALHAAVDPSFGVAALSATNCNYHWVAFQWDSANRVSGYFGVGGFQLGSRQTSWSSTASVAWVIAAGDTLRLEVSRTGTTDTWTFRIKHAADSAFTLIGTIVLSPGETDGYVPYTTAGYFGPFLNQLAAIGDVVIDSFTITDTNYTVPEIDSMEKTSGAWNKLMREMRLDGLADGRSGNRGDGTEEWRVGAYD